MFKSKLLGGTVVDEVLVQEPLDGASLGSHITQRMPCRDQLGVVLIQLVPETSERSPSLQRPGQASASRTVADALGEVDHVLIPDVRRQRIDENQIQLLQVDWVLPVDAGVAGPERHFTRVRVEEPSVLVVGLICERGCDLLNVDSNQVEHLLRLERQPGVLEDRRNDASPGANSRR